MRGRERGVDWEGEGGVGEKKQQECVMIKRELKARTSLNICDGLNQYFHRGSEKAAFLTLLHEVIVI